ncbi:SusC/RagA family TonB-linked outer membrane protein [Ilyomonas limi]|uniref:SusC/RagA family TonB-linked outer membrane protein n=2 Tax=Ilyomonas limi TaxID=2575867 RepID=A0A4U3KVU7_9BACT|nr:SusC/RagA family TonB-linked outer membrane protein [Ilyomonas limi]
MSKRLLLFFVIITAALPSFAQSMINGTVTAEDNAAVAGASVVVKNSGRGTSTDAYGKFSINAKKGDVLVISFVGFAAQEVPIENNQPLSIKLKREEGQLSDVLVTALGIKKEVKRIGYSIQEVKGADLVKARESNPINSLVGKVAGLNVGINQELLASPTVLLRGSPLNFYVVDGIPINSDTWNISPDDIETFTVLKGPTAAALYGSRGINGAILITTKRGSRNKKGYTVELNSSNQINKGFIAIPKVQNMYGGGEKQQYAFGDYNSSGNSVDGINDEDYDVWGPQLDIGLMLPQFDGEYNPTEYYDYTLGGVTHQSHIKPTPWISRGKDNLRNFLQAGFLTKNNVSFSAVSDRSNLRVSASQSYQTGITPNTSLNSVNFNLIESYDVSDKFRIEANLNYNRQFTPNIPDVAYGPNSIIYDVDIWTGADWNVLDPKIKAIWQPGKEGTQSMFVEYKRYQNPYFMSYEWLRGHYKNDLYGWASFTYRFNKNLNLMARSNITTYNLLRTEKEPWSAHPYGDEHNHGNYREDRRDLWENNTEILLSYNKENLGNTGIAISANAGGSARNMKFTSSYNSTNQLIVPEVYTFANSYLPVRSFSYGSNLLMLSAYYSADISYKNYFTVSTTGRVDKTSALPNGNNAFFYPSVSLSSVISDYVKMPGAISFLKVRGGLATVKDGGTTPYIGASFQSLGASSPVGYGNNYYTPYDGPTYGLSTPFYYTNYTYNNQTGAVAPNYVIDKNIKPSSRSSYEFGLDIRFLKNRLGLSGTYFEYKDGPQISNQYISETTGLSYFTTNGATTKRTGAELSLTGTAIQHKNFAWNVLINWSTYKEVYTAFAGGAKEVDNGTGYPYKIGDRVDELYADIEAKTPDGKVIVDESGFPIYLPKAQKFGHADPDFSWGINNKFSYKSFSLSFQFDGMVGGTIGDYVYRKLIEGGRGESTVTGIIGEARLYESQHWADPDYNGAIVNGKPILSGDMVQVVGGAGNIVYDPVTGVITNGKALSYTPNTVATHWIQDFVSSYYNDAEHTSTSKTYAKLREVVLTYTLPYKLLEKSFISKVDVSLVGRNLLYFFHSQFHDIDVDQFPGRSRFNGISREQTLQTPTTRSYGININVVF